MFVDGVYCKMGVEESDISPQLKGDADHGLTDAEGLFSKLSIKRRLAHVETKGEEKVVGIFVHAAYSDHQTATEVRGRCRDI